MEIILLLKRQGKIKVVLNAEMTGIQELKEKEIDEISAKGIKKIENHI
ncbi:6134_t:CDS:2 [Entrophospora sp. SA101]|nr:6134_t:CDS:2 [Entrophospora sp. SA101]